MYNIFIRRSALRELSKIRKPVRERIERRIEDLSDEPRPKGCRKLRGTDNAFRLRVGYFRVVYEIHAKEVMVIVVRIGHRRDIYRNRG